MSDGVIFVSGVYGVGKTTICNLLSNELSIPSFSSSELISKHNGEEYGVNKFVEDKDKNQLILIKAVKENLEAKPKFLLNGHFCILNSNNEIEYLPNFVYEELSLTKIILLEAEPENIYKNLQKRDKKNYSIEIIEELLKSERKQASKIASMLNIPLYIHTMCFNKEDFNIIVSMIKESQV